MPLSKWIGRRALAAAALALALVLSGSFGAALAEPSSKDAREFIQKVGNDVLEILRDDTLTNRDKFERLVQVLEGPVDLNLVARLIVGRHWRSATAEQQEQYLKLFRAYALDTLASQLHLYEGQEFEITGAQVVSDRDAVVTTRILSEDGRPPLKVDWRLREHEDGGLLAIDVIVENVSLIVAQRSEFSSVIERRGFDGLLGELRQRIEREA